MWPATDLPADFANIPDDSPKENVKASIPGTPQAQEAVIAADIPQTAKVDRTKARLQPTDQRQSGVETDPGHRPHVRLQLPEADHHGGTTAMVLRAKRGLVHRLLGSGALGRGHSIPAAIYAIPPSSPLYYVTYVKIYDVTPQYVVVGYTPGYMGTVVTTDGVVVYGTGYPYVPYIGATVWYPPPVTYGYAANVSWTPWTGWAVGFGVGWAMGPLWWVRRLLGLRPAPYWGPYAPYGYRGAAYGALRTARRPGARGAGQPPPATSTSTGEPTRP